MPQTWAQCAVQEGDGEAEDEAADAEPADDADDGSEARKREVCKHKSRSFLRRVEQGSR